MRLLRLNVLPKIVHVEAASCTKRRCCPSCQTPSERVHSSSIRTLADVPCIGRRVVLQVRVRKFRCANGRCARRVFAERYPDFVQPKARKTTRATEQICALGLALGGRGAQRLARLLGISVSGRTVLRALMRATPASPSSDVQVLGVDDFAFRRSKRYGTLLMDLERRRVIDLLPDRSLETLVEWLRRHPGVRIISRDRGGDYAAAARFGAPHAKQVVDRFHLVLNAGEMLERFLTRQHTSLREAARALASEDAPRRTTKRSPTDVRRREERRAVRLARFEQVRALSREGVSARQIAEETGVARATIYRYLTAERFPEHLPRQHERPIEPYIPYLQARWNAGEHRPLALWREIHAQGYPAGVAQVRRLVMAWRTPPPAPRIAGSPLPAKEEAISYSVRQTRWLLTKPQATLSAREADYLTTLQHLCPTVGRAQQLLKTFHSLVAKRAEARLDAWLEQCTHSAIAEFVRFAQSLRRDEAAVRAALCYPWTQGPVEGQINRLKLLKRQMYGRAGFALLRRRMLAQPTLPP
jgi:transposase